MPSSNVTISSAISRLNRILMLDKRDIVVVYIFGFLAGLVQLSLPLGIQSIISFVMAGSISTSIVVLIIMVLLGVFVNGLLQVRQIQILEKVKQKLFTRFSLEYGNSLPKLDIEILDNQYLPEMVNRYFDTVSLQKGLDKLLIDLPSAVIQILLGLILLSFYHPVFIAFGLFLFVVVFGIIRLASQKGLSTAMEASAYKYGIASWLQEIARNIKTFKFTKGSHLHLQKTDKLVAGYLENRTSHFRILLSHFWSLVFFKLLITAAMLTIGAWLLVTQQINVGQFIAADIVILAIISSVEKLITNLDIFYDALVSVEKLSTVTDAKQETNGTIALAPDSKGVTIAFKNISYGYSKERTVLNNINFEVLPGEIVHINGMSGAGKTTLIRLLTGAYKKYSGSLLVDDIPLGNYDLPSLRNLTGILEGSLDIFPDSIMNNITMGNINLKMDHLNKLSEMTGLDKFIHSNKAGYDTLVEPVGSKLPKSVSKNILLLRALLGEPRLLLLEEPFNHLELDKKVKVLDYIKNEMNTTTVIASVDNSISVHCDKVFLLSKNGELSPVKS